MSLEMFLMIYAWLLILLFIIGRKAYSYDQRAIVNIDEWNKRLRKDVEAARIDILKEKR